MPRRWIFLSYRRQDSALQAARLRDALEARFADQVFQDVRDIELGVDWTNELSESLLRADVLLLLIGPQWQSMTTERGVRINDPADYVYIELLTALDKDIRIIPLLMQGAAMPLPGTLPPKIERLLSRQALPFHDATFESDAARLVGRLERIRAEIELVRDRALLRTKARAARELAARKLAAYAEAAALKPRNLSRAGLLALESMMRFPLPGAHAVLRQARAGLMRLDAHLPHASEVMVIAESPKGTWLATGSSDGAVRIFDAHTLTLSSEFRAGGSVGALAFDSVEQWLAVASAEAKLHVLEPATGRAMATLDTGKPLVKLLVQSDATSTSLVGLSRESSNGTLLVWDASDWRPLWQRGMITDVAGQAQQQFLALAWGDHIALVQTTTGQMVEKFPLQTTATQIAWHPAYQVFAATTVKGELWQGFLAQSEQGRVQWKCEQLKGYAHPIIPLTFHPKAPWLALSNESGLCLLNLENLSAMSLPLKGQFGVQLVFSENGKFLAVFSPEDRSIAVWQLPAGRQVVEMQLESARAVCFGAREARLISASHATAARVWELPSGEQPLWMQQPGITSGIIFAPGGKLVAWVGAVPDASHQVRTNHFRLLVMNAADGEFVFSADFEGLFDGAAFDAAGNRIAIRSGDSIRVFDLPGGEETSPGSRAAEAWFPVPSSREFPLPETLSERETLQSLRSSSGRWLITRHPGRIRVWQETTSTELAAFPIPADVTSVCISPDDSYLAVGLGDGDLQIRTLPDGDEVATFPHDGAVTRFVFSPDGHTIAAAGVDAFVLKMWIVSPEVLMDDVRRRVDRDLTREEWELYVGDEPYSETRFAVSTAVRSRDVAGFERDRAPQQPAQ